MRGRRQSDMIQFDGRSRRRRRGRGVERAKSLGVVLLVLALTALFAAGAIFLTGSRAAAGKAVTAETGRQVVPESMASDLKKAGEGNTGQSQEARPERNLSGAPEEILAQMTLEEKVAQMFMITPEALTGVERVYSAGNATNEAIRRYPVGGLIYFSKNLESPEQVKKMLSNVKQYSRDRVGVTMFTAVDEEGGSEVARIGNNPGFSVPKVKDMAEIGAGGDPEQAYEAGKTIGAYLSQLGFNLDFAPVADVLTEPENQVVQKRSFGSEGGQVASFVVETVRGLEEEGVMATLKHFPGHGSTKGDTHEGYAYTDRSLGDLLSEELVPFQAGIKSGVSFIMAAHISVPKILGDDTPSSLSAEMITDVLRGQLGYQNIVITDSLSMKAITDRYSPQEAAVLAVKAGADILLMPSDFVKAHDGILAAVESGEIEEARIDQSVFRILSVKEGLD